MSAYRILRSHFEGGRAGGCVDLRHRGATFVGSSKRVAAFTRSILAEPREREARPNVTHASFTACAVDAG